MKNIISKTLAITLNFALVGTSFADIPGLNAAAAPKGPDFVATFTPPQSLGYVTGSYKGATDNPVILIQDLHANLGVQKKISAMLEFLQPKVASAGKAMVLGVEGAWEKLDVSEISKNEPKVRKNLSEFLLKEAEISGMEYFAAMSDKPVNLIGIENREDYLVHVSLVQKSMAARLKLAGQIAKLRQVVNNARSQAPRELKRLWRIEEDFHAGKIDLTRMEKELGRSLSNYGQAEKALEEVKMQLANARKGDEGFYLRNVVKSDHMLSLLSRLFRQQLTMEEVSYASGKVNEMLLVVRALMPGENLSLWKDTIQTAIDHYAVALVRDTPMAERAAQLAQANSGSSVVIVAGGFHADGITKNLQQKKISYVVLAPVVESHNMRDERIYLLRMLDVRTTDGAFRDDKLRKASRTVPTVPQITLPAKYQQGSPLHAQAVATMRAAVAEAQAGKDVDGIAAALKDKFAGPFDGLIAAVDEVLGLQESADVPGNALVAKGKEALARWAAQAPIQQLPKTEAEAKAAGITLGGKVAGMIVVGAIGLTAAMAIMNGVPVAELSASAPPINLPAADSSAILASMGAFLPPSSIGRFVAKARGAAEHVLAVARAA